MAPPPPVLLDLTDFDAVGVASEIVTSARAHAIEAGVDTKATISAPDSWHALAISCGATGNLELQIGFETLTTSRVNNLSKALTDREWQIDEDRGGARKRFRPGSGSLDIAFEVLGVLTLAGAPADTRSVVAFDASGVDVPLMDSPS